MLPIVQIIHRDGIIDLGWGHPDPTLLAPADVATAAAATIARHGSAALAYSWERGPGPLAEFLCDHLGRIDGRAPHPDELLITGGNSAGLDLTLTLLTRPGDVVLRRPAFDATRPSSANTWCCGFDGQEHVITGHGDGELWWWGIDAPV